MIKAATKSLAQQDINPYPQAQATYNGKSVQYTIISPYGFFSNAPVTALTVLLDNGQQAATTFGIENDYKNRPANLAVGECSIKNTLTNSIIYLKENGDIEITSAKDVKVIADNIEAAATGKIIAEAPDIELTGNIKITGNIELQGNITQTGDFITTGTISGTSLTTPSGVPFETHVHQETGTQTGGPQNP